MARIKREKLSDAEEAFRKEVALKFGEQIRNRYNGRKTAAAFALGISRQALYNYLNQEQTPGGRVIQRACVEWQITLNDRGYMITPDSFATETEKPVAESVQLSLFDAIQSLGNEQLTVKVLHKDNGSVRLEVAVRFAG